MPNIVLIDKNSHQKTLENTNDYYVLTKPTVLKVSISKDEIKSVVKQGDDLVINLNNGEKFSIESFFLADHSLVLEGSNQELLWVAFKDKEGNSFAEPVYNL